MTGTNLNMKRKMNMKNAYLKIVAVEDPESFKGDNGEDVAKQALKVEIVGTVTLMTYGRNVDRVKSLDLETGDEVAFDFTTKAPGPGIRIV